MTGKLLTPRKNSGIYWARVKSEPPTVVPNWGKFCPPGEHLAKSGDLFDCHNLEGVLLASGAEVRDAGEHRTAPQQRIMGLLCRLRNPDVGLAKLMWERGAPGSTVLNTKDILGSILSGQRSLGEANVMMIF